MSNRTIIIGSRGSDLALWQAHFIKDKLENLGHSIRIDIIKTQGDIIQHLSFEKMEGKGFFTKELETALRNEQIDLAVHSYKDLETDQPDDLLIAATSHRANAADLLLIKQDKVDQNQKWSLKYGAVVGTSSARRKMQLRHHRPDLLLDDIRGNVPTRIKKLRKGKFDAIVLAQAGVDRLGLDLSDLHSFTFDPTQFIPAPAQGVLACQIRKSDKELAQIVSKIHNKEVADLINVERRVLNLFHGGCQLPLGAYCIRKGGHVELFAIMSKKLGDHPSTVNLVATNTLGLAERAVEGLKKKILV